MVVFIHQTIGAKKIRKPPALNVKTRGDLAVTSTFYLLPASSPGYSRFSKWWKGRGCCFTDLMVPFLNLIWLV